MKDNERRKHSVTVATREELLGRTSSNTERRRQTSQRPAQGRTSSAEKRPSSKSRNERTEKPERRSSDTSRRRTPQMQEERRHSINEPAQKRRRKKKRNGNYLKYGLMTAAAIAAAFLLFFCITNIFASSKTRVRRAYANTVSTYQKRKSLFEEILGKDVEKLIKNGNTSQSFALALTDNTAGAQGLGISGEFNKSTSSKTADASVSATYKDASFAQIKMYTDNEKIMFSAPGIYDGWLEMDCDDAMTKIMQSSLGSNMEFSSDENYSLKLFSDEESQTELFSDFTEEFSDIFNKEINTLSSKAEYTKLKTKKAVSIDGEAKDLTVYSLDIKGTDFKNFLINILSNARTNKKIKAVLTNYATFQYENVTVLNMLFDGPEYIVDNYYKQMDDALEKLNRAEFTDTKAEICIYKGVIADLDFNTVYTIDDDKVNINLKGGMHGGKNPYEDVDLAITLSDDKQSLTAAYTEATDNIDKTITNTKNFVIGNGDKDLTLDTKLTFDRSTGIINGSANLKTPGGGYIDLTGSGNLTKNSGTTKIDAQEIKLNYNGAVNLVMNGSYEIKALNGKPKVPDGEKTDLFNTDEAKLNEIRNTIASNLNNVIGKLNEALASISISTGEKPAAQAQPTAEGESITETTTAETATQAPEDGGDTAEEDGEDSDN